jgi:hypothetical protein
MSYFLTNTLNGQLCLEVAAEMGIRMHTNVAFDTFGKPLVGCVALWVDEEKFLDLGDYWRRVANLRAILDLEEKNA